jgi:DNA-binding transcriptional LysR family regulator
LIFFIQSSVEAAAGSAPEKQDAMRISLEQLDAFVAVTSERSFSAAARKLGKSQSALSIAVGNLEVDLGVVLFDRSHRYPELTADGLALLRDAEAILNQCMTMENRANSLSERLESKLSIAIDEAISGEAISAPLAQFAAAFPHVELMMLRPNEQDMTAMVLDEKISLGVTCARSAYPKEIQFKRLGTIAFTNVAGARHPLAKMDSVSFSELSNYRQIVYLPGQQCLPTSEYLNAPDRWCVESYQTLLSLVSDGIGWATIPKRLLASSAGSPALAEQGSLTELKVEAYPFTEWQVGVDLVWSAGARGGKSGNWLRELLGRHAMNI